MDNSKPLTKAKIFAFNFAENELEFLAEITKDTSLAVGPKYNTIKDKHMLWGFNLFAVDGDNAVLLETYESEEEAAAARELIFNKLVTGQEVIVV